MKKILLIAFLLNSLSLHAINPDWKKSFRTDTGLIVNPECADAQNCLLCYNKVSTYSTTHYIDPYVLYSSNAGDSWDTLWNFTTGLYYDEEIGYYLESKGRIQSFSFPNKKLIVLDMDSSRLWRSTDMGATWHDSEIDSTLQDLYGNDYDDFCMDFLDENFGVICPSMAAPDPDDKRAKRIYFTHDGAKTWEEIRLPEEIPEIVCISNVQIINKNNIVFETVIQGPFSGLLKTTDGGETWQYYTLEPNIRLGVNELYFVNEKTGFYINSFKESGGGNTHHQIKKTTDGGETWELKKDIIVEDYEGKLNDIEFANSDVGYVSGYGCAYRTSDGGETWEDIYDYDKEKFEHGYYIALLSVADENTCLVRFSSPEIWKYEREGTAVANTPPPAFTLRPNPARDVLRVDFGLRGGRGRAEVCDLLGRRLIERRLSGEAVMPLDVSSLRPGAYMLRIADGGAVRTKIFVVER